MLHARTWYIRYAASLSRPTVQRAVLLSQDGVHLQQHLRRYQGPNSETLSPHLLLYTPSRLIGTAGHDTGHNFAPRTPAYYIEVLRCLVCDDLLEHKRPIGDPRLMVQIEEIMVYRRKNYKGRVVPQNWVIGGVWVETKESFMCHVGNRSVDEPYEACRD